MGSVDVVAPASGVDAFDALLEASSTVQRSMADDRDPWAGSRFAWLRALPSARRGRAAVEICSAWLVRLGHRVHPAVGSGVDRFVDGAAVEMKLSTLWGDGTYRFQQIRDTEAVDHLVLLGVSPDSVSIWVVPREVLFSHASEPSASASHRWLVFDAANPPAWLDRYGGSPQRAAEVAAALDGSGSARDQLVLF
jgi:hypothetical protein